MCGLLRSATLFRIRPEITNIAVRTRRERYLQDQKCRVYDQGIVTYEQSKLGLSAYYDKRYVLADGIHTKPLDFLAKFF